jgi:hypothetical protein
MEPNLRPPALGNQRLRPPQLRIVPKTLHRFLPSLLVARGEVDQEWAGVELGRGILQCDLPD